MAKLFQLKEIFPSDATSVMDEYRNKLHLLPRFLAHVLKRRTKEAALKSLTEVGAGWWKYMLRWNLNKCESQIDAPFSPRSSGFAILLTMDSVTENNVVY